MLIASAMRNACRTFASVAPTKRAVQERRCRAPASAGPSRCQGPWRNSSCRLRSHQKQDPTRLDLLCPGASARRQKSLRFARPPRESKLSCPDASVSRLFFRRVWAFSSQMTSGRNPLWRVRDKANAPSASYRVSPAAASRTRSRLSPWGRSSGLIAGQFTGDAVQLGAVRQGVLENDEELLQLDGNLHDRGQARRRRSAAACRR